MYSLNEVCEIPHRSNHYSGSYNKLFIRPGRSEVVNVGRMIYSNSRTIEIHYCSQMETVTFLFVPIKEHLSVPVKVQSRKICERPFTHRSRLDEKLLISVSMVVYYILYKPD